MIGSNKAVLILTAGFLAILTNPCFALIINTNAEYDNALGVSASDPQTATTGVISSHLENQDFFYSTLGEASAIANASGELLVSATQDTTGSDLGNNYTATSSWNETYINGSSTAMAYFLDFDISEVVMNAYWSTSASYSVNIMLNGVSLWNTTDFIYGGDDPTTTTLTVAAFSDTLSLGIYDSGNSFTLLYAITADVDGMEHGDSSVSLFDMDGTVTLEAITEPVPEPATILLFGTGIAGLLGTRLKSKKK